MKTDLYETITAKIKAELEKGTLPWLKPLASKASDWLLQFAEATEEKKAA